jgi:hypothetical protein
MRRFSTAHVLAALVLIGTWPPAGCRRPELQGNGVAASAVYALRAFDAVTDLSGIAIADVRGDDYRALVTCDENLLPHIALQVRAGVLYVVVDGREHALDRVLKPATECQIRVTAPHALRVALLVDPVARQRSRS